MDIQNAKLINCGNEFYPVFFNKLCEALEKGEVVRVYIDCIGHTRNNDTQEVYRVKLTQKYGDKLVIEKNEGAYSYSYCYQLTAKKDVCN